MNEYEKNNILSISWNSLYLHIHSPNTMQFLASQKVYLKDNNMVENQWVRIWSTEW